LDSGLQVVHVPNDQLAIEPSGAEGFTRIFATSMDANAGDGILMHRVQRRVDWLNASVSIKRLKLAHCTEKIRTKIIKEASLSFFGGFNLL
jgi:hypothetical protein